MTGRGKKGRRAPNLPEGISSATLTAPKGSVNLTTMSLYDSSMSHNDALMPMLFSNLSCAKATKTAKV